MLARKETWSWFTAPTRPWLIVPTCCNYSKHLPFIHLAVLLTRSASMILVHKWYLNLFTGVWTNAIDHIHLPKAVSTAQSSKTWRTAFELHTAFRPELGPWPFAFWRKCSLACSLTLAKAWPEYSLRTTVCQKCIPEECSCCSLQVFVVDYWIPGIWWLLFWVSRTLPQQSTLVVRCSRCFPPSEEEGHEKEMSGFEPPWKTLTRFTQSRDKMW